MEQDCPCPTVLEAALTAILATFLSHRGENGKISKDGFIKLLKDQLPHFPEANADELFKCVDQNDDQSMDFGEFSRMFVVFANLNYDAVEKLLAGEQKKS